MDDAAPPPVDAADVDDLRARLRGWRPVPLTDVAGWGRGTEPGYLADLLDSWAETYDWRPHEERIRALPWALSSGLRLVHQRAADPDAPAVVLLHGWPDSVLRFERVLPLLRDVHVVAPALPGYPFAAPAPAMSSAEMAELVAEALTDLGYARYVVSASDIGRGVAVALAATYPEQVAALHVTDVPLAATTAEPRTDDERAHRERADTWRATDGYLAQQAPRPHTLAVGLGDSPAGLAAWIVEKLRGWSDCGGDVESVWTRDELLTWVSAYWFTGAIGTSFGPYVQRSPVFPRIEVPTVVQQFPHELVPASRSVAERVFTVRDWREEPVGGHFAAWEQPERYAAGVRAALAR
ncbi:epoxide hydrolase family protein [Modestobacter sp. SYSU DS0657]